MANIGYFDNEEATVLLTDDIDLENDLISIYNTEIEDHDALINWCLKEELNWLRIGYSVDKLTAEEKQLYIDRLGEKVSFE